MTYSRLDLWTKSAKVRSCLVLLRAAMGSLALASCSAGPPSVTLNTASGQSPIFTPTAGQSGAQATPRESEKPAAGPIDRSGTYAGTAVPLDTGGGSCIATRNMSGFVVRGRSVRFGAFRGTIDATDRLQMFAGRHWIVGYFEGSTFSGQLDMMAQGNSRRGSSPRGCSFVLNLERVAP